MKTLKRMLAVMLAVVMMMGLGVTSMARETTYTVKIYLQTATRNASGVVTGTDKLNSCYPHDKSLITTDIAVIRLFFYL